MPKNNMNEETSLDDRWEKYKENSSSMVLKHNRTQENINYRAKLAI